MNLLDHLAALAFLPFCLAGAAAYLKEGVECLKKAFFECN